MKTIKNNSIKFVTTTKGFRELVDESRFFLMACGFKVDTCLQLNSDNVLEIMEGEVPTSTIIDDVTIIIDIDRRLARMICVKYKDSEDSSLKYFDTTFPFYSNKDLFLNILIDDLAYWGYITDLDCTHYKHIVALLRKLAPINTGQDIWGSSKISFYSAMMYLNAYFEAYRFDKSIQNKHIDTLIECVNVLKEVVESIQKHPSDPTNREMYDSSPTITNFINFCKVYICRILLGVDRKSDLFDTVKKTITSISHDLGHHDIDDMLSSCIQDENIDPIESSSMRLSTSTSTKAAIIKIMFLHDDKIAGDLARVMVPLLLPVSNIDMDVVSWVLDLTGEYVDENLTRYYNRLRELLIPMLYNMDTFVLIKLIRSIAATDIIGNYGHVIELGIDYIIDTLRSIDKKAYPMIYLGDIYHMIPRILANKVYNVRSGGSINEVLNLTDTLNNITSIDAGNLVYIPYHELSHNMPEKLATEIGELAKAVFNSLKESHLQC